MNPEKSAMAKNAKTTILPVSGMHCAGCVSSVERAIAAVPGVCEVSVNLVTGKAAIVHEGVAVEPLVAAVERAGYAVPREAVGAHAHGGLGAGAGALASDSHGEHAGGERAAGATGRVAAHEHVHDAGAAGEAALGRRFGVAVVATTVVMALGMGMRRRPPPTRRPSRPSPSSWPRSRRSWSSRTRGRTTTAGSSRAFGAAPPT